MAGKTKTPGIRDVANAAGVSVATASRVLAGTDYPVAPATRAKVVSAAAALGFVRNAMARSLSRSRSESIGVIVPVLHAYYAAMIEGIEMTARAHGLTVLLGLTRGEEDQRERLVTAFLERQVEGLVICAGAGDHVVGRSPGQMPVPVVLIGRQSNPGFPEIVTDNVAAGADVARHLWELGHRAFAYLAPDQSWHDFADRQRGAEQFLASTGEAFQFEVVGQVYTEADAYRLMTERLRAGLPATAVIASTDRHALSAMAALADRGRRVPEDVAVVGFDNYLTSQYLRPALTSMEIPSAAMGRLAVDTLVAAIAGRPVALRTELRATLVARQSSALSR